MEIKGYQICQLWLLTTLTLSLLIFTLKLLWELTITGTNMQQKGRIISDPAFYD